jgi:hypothetical protein
MRTIDMDIVKQFNESTKKVDVINEFIATFSQQGVVFTDQEIEIIFNRYATKFRDVVEHIDKGETKLTSGSGFSALALGSINK